MAETPALVVSCSVGADTGDLARVLDIGADTDKLAGGVGGSAGRTDVFVGIIVDEASVVGNMVLVGVEDGTVVFVGITVGGASVVGCMAL